MPITSQKSVTVDEEEKIVTIHIHVEDQVIGIRWRKRQTGAGLLKPVEEVSTYTAQGADFDALAHQQPVDGSGAPIAGVPDIYEQVARAVYGYVAAKKAEELAAAEAAAFAAQEPQA